MARARVGGARRVEVGSIDRHIAHAISIERLATDARKGESQVSKMRTVALASRHLLLPLGTGRTALLLAGGRVRNMHLSGGLRVRVRMAMTVLPVVVTAEGRPIRTTLTEIQEARRTRASAARRPDCGRPSIRSPGEEVIASGGARKTHNSAREAQWSAICACGRTSTECDGRFKQRQTSAGKGCQCRSEG